ncbi:MAG TPA: hypothetical protein VG125_28645 [Pirellulales bacterium]|jgi:hypothetical protein|nr:hypothetical protein [Pirellulales bacterium]
MRGPGQAILWQFWRRHLWGLSADLAYLAIAPAIIGLLPLDAGRRLVAGVLGLVGVAVLTHLLGVFSYGFEADLAKKESGYPPRAFVLPVSTWTLTSWPAIGGAAGIVMAWLMLAAGVWRPAGYATPLWWPGVGAAALLGMSQAIGWTPFSYHWLRLVLAVVIGGILAAMAAIAIALFDVNELLLAGAFGAAWTLSFAAAYVGVGRARRGQAVSWRWLDRVGSRFMASNRAARGAFRSPLRAQLWFEMRRHGWMMPIFLATVLVCVVPILLVPPRQAVPPWRILALVAGLPPLLAGIVALGFGKADPFQRGVVLPYFIATRPVSCARLVAAKMLAAACTVLISCGILLAVMLPWCLRSGNQQSFAGLWQGVATWKVAAVATLAAVCWIAMSWRQLAAGMWVALTGREWVGTVASFAFALVLLSSLLGGLWLFYHPELREHLPMFVPWCLAMMLSAKVATGCWCARQLVSRRLIAARTVGKIFLVWCAAVASLCGAMFWLAPAGTSSLQLMCGATLVVPFARLAGAPLALAFNRHR